MENNGGLGLGSTSNSWLTAVKRAFRKNTSSRRNLHREHKRAERRRWLLFREHSSIDLQPTETKEATTHCIAPKTPILPTGQQHAIAVAVEIIRLTQPTNAAAVFNRQSSAKVIQTAFRGYMARRALIALKGIVKLQALIRGQIVRKQAHTTMKYIQALLRVQARVRDQRIHLSRDSGRRWSMDADASDLWESKHLKHLSCRRSRTRNRSSGSIPDDWKECPRTLEAIWKARNEAAMAQKASVDHKKESIKFVEVDSLKRSSFSTRKGQRSSCQSPIRSQAIIGQRPRSPQVHAVHHSTANTPSLRSNRYNISTSTDVAMPNYMVPTESAKARIRSQSAPRQRSSTPDRKKGGSAKKYQSNPAPNPDCLNFRSRRNGMNQKLRSPSFKCVQAHQHGRKVEQFQPYREHGCTVFSMLNSGF